MVAQRSSCGPACQARATALTSRQQETRAAGAHISCVFAHLMRLSDKASPDVRGHVLARCGIRFLPRIGHLYRCVPTWGSAAPPFRYGRYMQIFMQCNTFRTRKNNTHGVRVNPTQNILCYCPRAPGMYCLECTYRSCCRAGCGTKLNQHRPRVLN